MRLLLIFLTVSTVLRAQCPAEDSHWGLIQEWDFKMMTNLEFDNNWVKQNWDHALVHGSNVEPQYYQPENAILNSDGLRLTVKNESLFGVVTEGLPPETILSDFKTNYRMFEYTSAMVISEQLVKYGYIEGRIKLPEGHDFFPAFWTFLGDSSEIDIFEMLPSEEPFYLSKKIQKTNIVMSYGPGAIAYPTDVIIDDYTEYHKYGVEWNPNYIVWYFDDEPIRRFENPGVHKEVKILLNLALTPFVQLDPSKTVYPAHMDVEYVKYYKLQNSCQEEINECSFWFGGFDQTTVKKSIKIGEGGCGNVQPANTDLIMRASDEVVIYGDFEVPLSAELTVSVNPCH